VLGLLLLLLVHKVLHVEGLLLLLLLLMLVQLLMDLIV
jgi:hypothetical protein